MEINKAMVAAYITAVADALKAAGHKVDEPDIPSEDGSVFWTSTLIVPDAFTDDFGGGRTGLALIWDSEDGWQAAMVNYSTGDFRMHTDLLLGVVPDPDVLVRSVAAMVDDGSLRVGRVAPDTAELLAAYTNGTARSPQADLIAITADRDFNWDECVCCGSTKITHRALFFTEALSVSRTAWCNGDECQDDRQRSAWSAVAVEPTDGGGFKRA